MGHKTQNGRLQRAADLISAVLRARCPRCRIGAVFAGPMRMHTTCPQCGITYERESGFFAMSIFVGYILAFFIFSPILAVLYIRQVERIWLYMVPTAVIVLLAPIIFRYARVIWLHLDEWMDPRPQG